MAVKYLSAGQAGESLTIEFKANVCSDLAQSSTREWLETNGLGGFACSTISGMNTRRYHDLLTAATHPPVGRFLLLSKLEETLVVGDQRIDLCTNQYVGAVHPAGYKLQTQFKLDPFPIFTFEWQGVRIEKTVFMAHGHNATVIEYRLLECPSQDEPILEIRPLIAFRDYHSTTHENAALDPTVEESDGIVSIAPYENVPRMYLAHNADRLEKNGSWYRQFFYQHESERGLDALEDLFNPLCFFFELKTSRQPTIIASIEPVKFRQATEWRDVELARRKSVASSSPLPDPLVRQLTTALEQFVVKRAAGSTMIAGYPWFTDWTRDTMVSLPGLLHLQGSSNLVKEILQEFSRHADQGMLPNRFPDSGENPEFNTVDGTLWFFEAVRAYAEHCERNRVNESFVKDHLYGLLKDMIDWHIRGTRFNIHVGDDGLLESGEAGVQLTWMDAKVDDWAVTPRMGKPVEVQALWYNALKTLEHLAIRFGDQVSAKRFGANAATTRRTFNAFFWNAEADCLYDVMRDSGADPTIRPNQLFAVSLRHSLLGQDRATRVLGVVERELLTPFGLRSLSPRDPQYKGRYQGGPHERDLAYHQGTAWPWLLGPYITAMCRVYGWSFEARQRARALLKPLETQLTEAGLGQISEIYDGDTPQLPHGCFAQAWSAAELLRVLCEDIYPSENVNKTLANSDRELPI